MKLFALACITAAATTFAAPAGAAVITGLFNTGQGFASGSQDTHYALTITQGSTVLDGTRSYVATNNVWPISPWMANGELSKWVTPTANQGQSYDSLVDGYYQYRLTFDLTGYAATSASFAGRFMADNAAQVFLNGKLLSSGSSFVEWTQFSASTGFLNGLNTIDFLVQNYALSSGNPTGLRTEFTSSAVTRTVPEPGTPSIFLGGLAIMGALAIGRRGR